MGVRLEVRTAAGRPLQQAIAYSFEQSRVRVGRGAGADVRIPDLTVSEQHATLSLDGSSWSLTDDDSTNGTTLNGQRIPPGRSRKLTDGDVIGCGLYELSFSQGLVPEPVTAERTAELARRLFRESRSGSAIGGPRLVVVTGDRPGRTLEIPAPPARVLIGRDAHCQLVLDDSDVSREHAEVIRDLDGVLVRDLGSKNGIKVGANPVSQRRLRDADEIGIGDSVLLFEEPADEPMRALASEGDLAVSQPPEGSRSEPPTAALADAPSERGSTPKRPSTPPDTGPSLDADVIIYALAAVIFAVSVAGLLMLMRGD